MHDDHPSVLVTRRLPDGSLKPLHEAGIHVRQWESDDPMPRDVLLSEVASVQGLLPMVSDRVDQELLDSAPLLKVVGNYAVGFDNIDVPACTHRGVVACNTPGVLTETTADMAWTLLMAVARRLVEGVDYVRAGNWKTWGPLLLLGHDVHHATIGIAGMGRIGWEVAKRAFGFDMRVLYYDVNRREDLEKKGPIQYVDFDTLLRESDFISVHVDLNPSTRHLFSTPQLRQMKRTAYLINAARGPIVDPDALYAACRDGEIAGAGLDVTEPEPIPMDSPLLTLPNVVIAPHIASASHETRYRMGELAARNVAAVLSGHPAVTPLNPEVLARA